MDIKRNADGQVSVDGEEMITIPKDVSILTLMSTNEVFQGEHYREDFWVYINGVKTRKWFLPVDRYLRRVWMPNVHDLQAIEARYMNAVLRHKKKCKIYNDAFRDVFRVGIAHAKPTHKYELFEGKTWWKYKATSEYINFEWITEPEVKINHEIGQAYYEATQIIGNYNHYLTMFERAVLFSAEKMLRSKGFGKNTQEPIPPVIINNHRYYFEWTKQGALNAIRWPEYEETPIVIG